MRRTIPRIYCRTWLQTVRMLPVSGVQTMRESVYHVSRFLLILDASPHNFMITTDYNNSFCKIQYFNSINNGKSRLQYSHCTSNPIAYNKLIKFLFLKVNSSSFSAILAQSWFLRIMFSFCSRADLSSISPASLRILSISGPPSVI